MPQRLPLFPLGSVLFPGLVLPLNIFEPRYRLLVQDLVGDLDAERLEDDDDVRGFGVVAIRSGHEVGVGNAHALHEVGCVALLREVTETEEGGYEIVTVGATRFRVVGIDDSAGTPYLTALVEPFGDDEEDVETPEVALLASGVRGRFAQYRDALGIGGAEAPEDPAVLSYLVAAAMVLTVADRQRLLEAESTRDRLRRERELLASEIGLVRALGTVPATDLPDAPANPN